MLSVCKSRCLYLTTVGGALFVQLTWIIFQAKHEKGVYVCSFDVPQSSWSVPLLGSDFRLRLTKAVDHVVESLSAVGLFEYGISAHRLPNLCCNKLWDRAYSYLSNASVGKQTGNPRHLVNFRSFPIIFCQVLGHLASRQQVP